MPTNIYDQPFQAQYMNTYVPMPYQEILQAGAVMQERYDTAEAMDEQIQDQLMQSKYLKWSKEDAAMVKQKQQEYSDRINKKLEEVGGDYGSLIPFIKSEQKKYKKEITTGQLGHAAANYGSYWKNYEEEKKRLKKGKINENSFRTQRAQERANYHGVGDINDLAGIELEYAVVKQDIQEEVFKVADKLEAKNSKEIGEWAHRILPSGHELLERTDFTDSKLSPETIYKLANAAVRNNPEIAPYLEERAGLKVWEAMEQARNTPGGFEELASSALELSEEDIVEGMELSGYDPNNPTDRENYLEYKYKEALKDHLVSQQAAIAGGVFAKDDKIKSRVTRDPSDGGEGNKSRGQIELDNIVQNQGKVMASLNTSDFSDLEKSIEDTKKTLDSEQKELNDLNNIVSQMGENDPNYAAANAELKEKRKQVLDAKNTLSAVQSTLNNINDQIYDTFSIPEKDAMAGITVVKNITKKVREDVRNAIGPGSGDPIPAEMLLVPEMKALIPILQEKGLLNAEMSIKDIMSNAPGSTFNQFEKMFTYFQSIAIKDELKNNEDALELISGPSNTTSGIDMDKVESLQDMFTSKKEQMIEEGDFINSVIPTIFSGDAAGEYDSTLGFKNKKNTEAFTRTGGGGWSTALDGTAMSGQDAGDKIRIMIDEDDGWKMAEDDIYSVRITDQVDNQGNVIFAARIAGKNADGEYDPKTLYVTKGNLGKEFQEELAYSLLKSDHPENVEKGKLILARQALVPSIRHLNISKLPTSYNKTAKEDMIPLRGITHPKTKEQLYLRKIVNANTNTPEYAVEFYDSSENGEIRSFINPVGGENQLYLDLYGQLLQQGGQSRKEADIKSSTEEFWNPPPSNTNIILPTEDLSRYREAVATEAQNISKDLAPEGISPISESDFTNITISDTTYAPAAQPVVKQFLKELDDLEISAELGGLFRTQAYNNSLPNSVKNSYHTIGLGMDIAVTKDSEEYAKIIKYIKEKKTIKRGKHTYTIDHDYHDNHLHIELVPSK